MSTTHASDRFTALPAGQTLAATVVALEIHQQLPGRIHVLIRQLVGF